MIIKRFKKWLMWQLAPKEMAELYAWRLQVADHQRCLSNYKSIRLVLINITDNVYGRRSKHKLCNTSVIQNGHTANELALLLRDTIDGVKQK